MNNSSKKYGRIATDSIPDSSNDLLQEYSANSASDGPNAKDESSLGPARQIKNTQHSTMRMQQV